MPSAPSPDSLRAALNAFTNRAVIASPEQRIALCRECIECVAAVADEWAEVAATNKGLPATSPVRVEDLLSGPAVVLRLLQLTIQTLSAIQQGGSPPLPGRPVRLPSGQLSVPVLPTSGLFDSLTFFGIHGSVRLQADASESTLHDRLIEAAAKARYDYVTAVLGAGNVSSIPATDSLQKIMFEGSRVLLKLNPVNEYLASVFERAFAPLIRENLLLILTGGPEVGATLIHHEAVHAVHITGSAATHDAIVWGSTAEERSRRKLARDPLLKKSITSELGNVSPWIIVPGVYSTRQLDSQAQHVAASITNNVSFNCLATKVIVTWQQWPQRDEFLQRVEHHLQQTPLRPPYYPGAEERYQRFTRTQTTANASGCLPWTLLVGQSIDERPELFQEESFVGVCAETALAGDSPEQFLTLATHFVNERMTGTLCASITVPPAFRREHAPALARSLADLRYGTVCVNQWSGVAYALASPPWGAYPGSHIENVGSGMGTVHNTYLLDHIEKTVLEGPLVNIPHPVWFPSHRNSVGVAQALIRLYHRPSVLRLPGLGAAVVKGMCLLLAMLMGSAASLRAADKSGDQPAASTAAIKSLKPHDKVQYELQAALINASPGDVIELAEGTYHFTTELNVVCDNITIRGAGREKTILSFRNQSAGSSGLVATGNAFVIESLAVEDTVGNAIKVLGAQDVTFRDVRVEWTGGPKSTNGAYGIYPVECQNVLIENCVSIGASDSGIYVGQSQDVIVRGCRAERNVAGIEIENTLCADVYDNTATHNTGGILVFNLPGLTQTNGGNVRVFRNRFVDNNHENFAPQGTMVADVPAGTGVMLLATDHVELFENEITGHQTSNILIVSFLITERKINDKKYDPFPEHVSIHDNKISGGGQKPGGQLGTLLLPVAGGSFPDIFFDGILSPATPADNQGAKVIPLRIRDNGEATFANMNVADLSLVNIGTGKYKIERDLKPFGAEIPALPVVTLKPHGKASSLGNPAVAVYRAVPQLLSKWGLFVKRDKHWSPAADLIEYELNTPLFSDDTIKHRAVRLPSGGQMTWHGTESLEFPVGTVIAKTFAYPDDKDDLTGGERYVETRIEHREASGWYGYTYVWNAEQTDAHLSLGGDVVPVSWKDEQGVTRQNQYQIPNANQCLSCHARDDKYVPLGTTARNLNRTGLDKNVANQLTSWVERGLLIECPTPDQRPVLATYDDPQTGSVDQRARAWLEVNCAHCHNPLGSARTSGLDLRTVQTDPGRFGVFKSPVAAGKGSGGRRYDIIPGKPDESILMFRLETEEPGARMPSLARNLIHEESNQLIREWILSMPADHAAPPK